MKRRGLLGAALAAMCAPVVAMAQRLRGAAIADDTAEVQAQALEAARRGVPLRLEPGRVYRIRRLDLPENVRLMVGPNTGFRVVNPGRSTFLIRNVRA